MPVIVEVIPIVIGLETELVQVGLITRAQHTPVVESYRVAVPREEVLVILVPPPEKTVPVAEEKQFNPDAVQGCVVLYLGVDEEIVRNQEGVTGLDSRTGEDDDF